MGVPPKCLVSNGKAQSKMDDLEGTPILGNRHFDISFVDFLTFAEDGSFTCFSQWLVHHGMGDPLVGSFQLLDHGMMNLPLNR